MVTARQLPLLGDAGRPPVPRLLRPASGREPDGRGGHGAGTDGPRLVQLVLLSGFDRGGKPPLAAQPRGPGRVDAPARPRAGVAAVALFRQRVALASVDPARNRARFYLLTWQPGLWGGGALVRTWGRQGAPSRSLAAVYHDRAAAQPAIVALLRRRVRNGYLIVDWE